MGRSSDGTASWRPARDSPSLAGPKITSYRGLTPEVNVAFARATNRVRLALDYWHGETIVLGVQGPVRVDSVTTRVTWPVTRRFEFGTHAGVSDVSTLDSRTSTIYRGGLVGSWSPGGLYTVARLVWTRFSTGHHQGPRSSRMANRCRSTTRYCGTSFA